jgi:hypothetical protein
MRAEIEGDHWMLLQFSDEKLALSNQCYDLLDYHLGNLDKEIEAFNSDLIVNPVPLCKFVSCFAFPVFRVVVPRLASPHGPVSIRLPFDMHCFQYLRIFQIYFACKFVAIVSEQSQNQKPVVFLGFASGLKRKLCEYICFHNSYICSQPETNHGTAPNCSLLCQRPRQGATSGCRQELSAEKSTAAFL